MSNILLIAFFIWELNKASQLNWFSISFNAVVCLCHELRDHTMPARIKHYLNDYIFFFIWWYFFLLWTDMDVQDACGNTPLHITVEEDAFDAMNYLLSMYVVLDVAIYQRNHSIVSSICVRGILYLFFFLFFTEESVQIFWTIRSNLPFIWRLSSIKLQH